MASAVVHNNFTSNGPLGLGGAPFAQPQLGNLNTAPAASGKRDVKTTLNYYKANEDGSPPHPTYVDKPETYARPSEPLDVTVNDIRGEDHLYSLDKNGFQIYRHTAKEKDFLNDEQIKAGYYPEVEQLLKDA